MSKKEKRQFPCLPLLLCTLAAALAGTAFFRSLRAMWVFYDPNLKVIGGATGLFLILLFNIAALLTLACAGAYSGKEIYEKKPFKIIAAVCLALTALLMLGDIAIAVINGFQTNLVVLMYLKRELVFVVPFALLVFLLIAFPITGHKSKKIIAGLTLLAVSAVMLFRVYPSSSYEITSDPCVMDTGSGYSVVFPTNAKGTAYIEYEYGGKSYKTYAQNNGRIISDRYLHSINVPYEHLDGNSYKVGGTRVIEDFSYGSRLGKSAEKGPYKLKTPVSDTQKYLVVSDWHSYLKDAYSAISYIGDYDAVLLLGDAAAGMDFEEEAVKFIAEFGGRLTGGTMPAIYVRGNHDTRGEFASQLSAYLGYDNFDYQVSRGPYSFLVLDSGEDKEDSHVEYGGLDDYYTNRIEMIDRLESAGRNGAKTIALTHAWQVSEPEKDLSLRAWDCFDRYGVSFVISGHMHECRFLDGADDSEKEYLEKYPDITAYIDGGHHGKTYIASAITLSPSGVYFEAYDNSGNKVINEEKPWR